MYPIKYFLNTDYQEMELLGVTGLFSNVRIERESLPEGFYKYSLREGEEDYFSTVENAVLVNHSGDFICKKELNLGDEGCVVLDDYGFTDQEVNLDEFFGVDIKTKVAELLDLFMKDIAPYEYADNLTVGTSIEEGNMVSEIREMLDDRDQAEGIFKELSEICEEVSFADVRDKGLAFSLKNKLYEIVRSFPEKHVELSDQIVAAENKKVQAISNSQPEEISKDIQEN